MNTMEKCAPAREADMERRAKPEAGRARAALLTTEAGGGREEALLARIGEDLDSLGKILSWLAGAVTALRREESGGPRPPTQPRRD